MGSQVSDFYRESEFRLNRCRDMEVRAKATLFFFQRDRDVNGKKKRDGGEMEGERTD